MMLTRLHRPHIEALVLALSLQAAVSLGAIGVDTQVAASHLVLPYFVAAAAFALFTGKRFPLTIGWWWIAGFFAAAFLLMLHGLYIGLQHTGELSEWGVRRVVSTALMAGYFLTGVYLASYGSRISDDFALFFVAVAASIALVSFLGHFAAQFPGIASYGRLVLSTGTFRLQGLMNSPVLFSWLLLSALAFQYVFQDRLQATFPKLNVVGFGLLFAALIVIGTKAAWVGAAVTATVLLVAMRPRPSLRPAGGALLLAVGLVCAAVLVPPGHREAFLGKMAEENMGIAGSAGVREGQLTLALELIREHPLWGVGLGSYHWEEARHGLPVQHYLHNSLAWLWTELGPLAVVLFLAFFARVAHALWPTRAANRGDPFVLAVFALLWGFAAISTVDEVLYQRYLWVFVGAALTIPARKGAGLSTPEAR